MSSHKRLAASAAPRWLRCWGSIAYVEFLKREGRIPEASPSNAASILGTSVHSLIELAIEDDIHPEKISKKLIKSISPDLGPHEIQSAALAFREAKQLEHDGFEVFSERKYDLSLIYGAETGGTADITGIKEDGPLVISDYKNGKGIVEPESYQLKIYDLGAYHELNEWYNFTSVRNVIIQPNGKHRLGPIRSDEFSISDLLRFEEKTVIPAIEAIKLETATLNPGEIQCEWCEARHLCEANAKQSMALAEIDFKNVAEPQPELPAPKTLTDEQLAFIVDNKSRLMKFVDACESYVFEKIKRTNKPIGHYQIQDKVGNRKLVDKCFKDSVKKHRLTQKEFMVHESKMMNLTEMKGHLLAKGWDGAKIKSFMDEITEKPVTGQELVKVQCDAEKDFREIDKPRRKRKLRRPSNGTGTTTKKPKRIRKSTTKPKGVRGTRRARIK